MKLIVIILMPLLWAHAFEIPPNYDTRDKWGSCNAFAPKDQGTCNSCSALALASSLGVRACIRDRRNVSFSSQHIWDCYSGSCKDGVNINIFMLAVMEGDMAEYMLKRDTAMESGLNGTAEANASACASQKSKERIESVGYHAEYWIGMLNSDPLKNRNPSNISNSVRSMQTEILLNGPIVAILHLTATEMLSFSQWKNKGDAEVLSVAATAPHLERRHLHAVTVIGWGSRDKTFYWKILNSFGEKWGVKGVGNIPGGFGAVEHEWYAAVSTPLPCAQGDCAVLDGFTPKNNQSRTKSKDDGMFLSSGGILLLDSQKRNSSEDAVVLIITALCMLVLSCIICTMHGHLEKKSKRMDFDLP
jgi:hypothetical protein